MSSSDNWSTVITSLAVVSAGVVGAGYLYLNAKSSMPWEDLKMVGRLLRWKVRFIESIDI
jgi:hypothetical protein